MYENHNFQNRMHSHMRELTYSVVRNVQQKLLTDRLRFCPALARTFADEKEKGVAAVPPSSPLGERGVAAVSPSFPLGEKGVTTVPPSSPLSEKIVTTVPPSALSHHAKRRDAKRQKDDTLSLVKEIVAENDR